MNKNEFIIIFVTHRTLDGGHQGTTSQAMKLSSSGYRWLYLN
jgi:hypothetical protein